MKGVDPCPLLEKHAGIWKFDENKSNQTQDQGTRFATGLRQMPAITWHDDALFIAMNNRDQLDVFWPSLFTAKDNAERPSEPLYRAVQGSDFGWPYCYYDYTTKMMVLNPEYGGDGKNVGRCGTFTPPVAAFPAHWAPVDVKFYTGTQFPAKYRNGAFIAFHGSWNRGPEPQAGYNVTFQPFAERQGRGRVRGVRGRLCRQGAADEPRSRPWRVPTASRRRPTARSTSATASAGRSGASSTPARDSPRRSGQVGQVGQVGRVDRRSRLT